MLSLVVNFWIKEAGFGGGVCILSSALRNDLFEYVLDLLLLVTGVSDESLFVLLVPGLEKEVPLILLEGFEV